MAAKERPLNTHLPHPSFPQVAAKPGQSMAEGDDPQFALVKEEPTGYSVEDAYRVLAGMPLTAVETTPVE